MITCNTCDSNAKNSIEVDSCKECSHADLIKVTIQRTEYREHTFEIPSGIERVQMSMMSSLMIMIGMILQSIMQMRLRLVFLDKNSLI